MSNPAYPTSLPISKESRRVLRDGRTEDITGDGSARVRKLYADKWDFDIKHPMLTSVEMATLEAFYSTYGTASAIDLVWPEDGVTYTVRFGRGAIGTSWVSASRRDATVHLVGV